MFCINCGECLDNGMKFCPQCGTKVPIITEGTNIENKVKEKKRNTYSGQKVTEFQEGMCYEYSFGNNKARIYLQEILNGTKKVIAIVQKDSMARQLYPDIKPIDQRFGKSKGMKDRYLAEVAAGNIVELPASNLAKVEEAFEFEGSLSALATMLSGESIAPVNAWRIAKQQEGATAVANSQPATATVTQQSVVSNPVTEQPGKTEECVNTSKDNKPIYWGEPKQEKQEKKEKVEKIDIKSFAGRFDAKSCYGRKFYRTIGSADWINYTDNYREYDGYLYFLNNKVKLKDELQTQKDCDFVFVRINLSNYQQEIIKEFDCISLRKYERDCDFGLVYTAHFSISHGKIWYITDLNEGFDGMGEKQVEYVVRCLDIETKEEAIVFKLPKGVRGRFPIVQGNIMTVTTYQNYQNSILCYDLRTGKKAKRACWNVCSYNDEYIFYQGNEPTYAGTNFYAIHTATGEIKPVKKWFQEKTGIKMDSIEYIDSYHKCIYGETRYKPEDGGKKISGWVIVSFDGSLKPIDKKRFTAPRVSWSGLDSCYDGRFEMLAFNGKSCCSNVHNDSTLYITDVDGNVIEKELKKGEYRLDGESYTLATANDIVICALDPEYVYMYHNDQWTPILKNKTYY